MDIRPPIDEERFTPLEGVVEEAVIQTRPYDAGTHLDTFTHIKLEGRMGTYSLRGNFRVDAGEKVRIFRLPSSLRGPSTSIAMLDVLDNNGDIKVTYSDI